MNNMSKEVKAFRCKVCKEEFDDLYEIEKHVENKHRNDQIEYLPKSKTKCPYEYFSSTSNFTYPKRCNLNFGHRGSHEYTELQIQVQPNKMFSGWRKVQ